MILGIDEVGRGCLAGPVCVAAVALRRPLKGLGDSKTIPAPRREILAAKIKRHAIWVGIGWASPQVIDTYGLTTALRVATLRAILPVDSAVSQILLDGRDNYLKDNRVTTIIKGDASVPAISAASIVAKVARDHYMAMVAKIHPEYGFERHVGYGTIAHRAALGNFGPSPLHRMSFGFLKEFAEA